MKKDIKISKEHWFFLNNFKLMRDYKSVDDSLCEIIKFWEEGQKKEKHKHK